MIRITIKTDNAAFSDGNKAVEVARILRQLAQRYEESEHWKLVGYDVNGNSVAELTETTGRRR